ncbi:UNVERIFIED_CONTAM: hypothetical protein FKN15_002782 [Acipenser sinensis]
MQNIAHESVESSDEEFFDARESLYRAVLDRGRCTAQSSIDGMEDSERACRTHILILVLHGGNILDSGGGDQNSKMADINTFRSVFQKVARAHFPAASERVQIKLVPCSAICTEAFSLVSNLFHPADPSASRLEPLLHGRFHQLAPFPVPRYQHCPLGDGRSNLLADAIHSSPWVFLEPGQALAPPPAPASASAPASAPVPAPAPAPAPARRASQTSMGSEVSGCSLSQLASTITNISSAWWGTKRLDYALYCPDVLTAFPTVALPHLFHASYWESTDVVAFVLCQVMRCESVNAQEADGSDSALFSPSNPREKWQRRRTPVKLRNVTANHRVNDVIAAEDGSQTLIGRFMYGPLDMVTLTGEKVDVQLMTQPSSGRWVHFDTEVTNSNGRVSYTIPEDKRLDVGVYPIKMIVKGDQTSAEAFLTVLPRGMECVVFSIDGSFAASVSIMGSDPKVRAGAVDVCHIKISAAYGSMKDISVYNVLGLSPSQIYIVGRPSKKYQNQCQPSSGRWVHFDTEVTNSNGRVSYTIPEDKRLGVGVYPIKMIVKGDQTSAEAFLTVLPRGMECVVFSIDGSFAASVSIMGSDPKVRAGAVDVVRHWQDLGYLIIYITGRPDMQKQRVVSWLSQHNFPQGMIFFSDGLVHDPLRQKTIFLRNLVQECHIKISAAYGSMKDISVYNVLGLSPSQIYIVGRPSKKYQNQCQFGHRSRPKKSSVRMVLRKGSFGLSAKPDFLRKRAHLRRTMSVQQPDPPSTPNPKPERAQSQPESDKDPERHPGPGVWCHIKISAAYGSMKDISVYNVLGLSPSQIYIVGRPSKKYQNQCQFLSEGYAAHLSSLQFGHRSRPKKSSVRMVLRKGSFGLSVKPDFLRKRAHLRRTMSVQQPDPPSTPNPKPERAQSQPESDKDPERHPGPGVWVRGAGQRGDSTP